jgi:hypothetical protein
MAVESEGRTWQAVVGFCGDGLLERGVSANTTDADMDTMTSKKVAVDRELTVEEEIRQKLDSRKVLNWANLTNRRVTGNIGNSLSYKLCADSRRKVAIQRGEVLDARKGFFYTIQRRHLDAMREEDTLANERLAVVENTENEGCRYRANRANRKLNDDKDGLPPCRKVIVPFPKINRKLKDDKDGLPPLKKEEVITKDGDAESTAEDRDGPPPLRNEVQDGQPGDGAQPDHHGMVFRINNLTIGHNLTTVGMVFRMVRRMLTLLLPLLRMIMRVNPRKIMNKFR